MESKDYITMTKILFLIAQRLKQPPLHSVTYFEQLAVTMKKADRE
jgi:hypothetical protein